MHHRTFSLRTRFAVSMAVASIILCIFLGVFINLATAFFPGTRLYWISTFGVLIAIAGGGGSAYWLAGLALWPLREMESFARSITHDTLQQRFHLTGPQDELHTLAETMDQMLERLATAFAQQERFVADAAHELRTPLATIRANLDVLAEDPHASIADYQATMATCERSVTRLEHLIHALLLLATTQEGLHVAPLDLGEVIHQEYTAMQRTAEIKQITMTCTIEPDIMVVGNASLLGSVIRNLLDNALCYTSAGGLITVSLTTRASQAVIEVADTGIGIPAAEQAAIFERFYRVDTSRSRTSGGFGLGLALVQHIVHQHNGIIHVSSEPGRGSCFAVTLPQAGAQLNRHLTSHTVS